MGELKRKSAGRGEGHVPREGVAGRAGARAEGRIAEADGPLAAPWPRVLRVVKDGLRKGEPRHTAVGEREVEGGRSAVALTDRNR